MNISLGNTLTWNPVVGVASYTIELISQVGESLALFSRTDASISALALLANRTAGTYQVRVRGEADGFIGAWSDVLILEFVLFEAPTGLTVV